MRPTLPAWSPLGAALVAPIAAALATASPAAAQTIAGTVADAATGDPVEQAVVIMVDADGERVATVFTEADGRFALSPPGSGRYQVGVAALGYQQAISPMLDLKADDVALDFVLPPNPVALDSLQVVSSRNTPDAGRLRGLLTPERHRGTLVGRLMRAEIESRSSGGDLVALIASMNIPGLRARRMALSTGAPQTGVCVELGRNRSVLHKTEGRVSLARDQLGALTEDDIAARAGACAMMAVYIDDYPVVDPSEVLAAVSPDDLERVEVLPPLEALARYGARAGNGALILTTRNRRR